MMNKNRKLSAQIYGRKNSKCFNRTYTFTGIWGWMILFVMLAVVGGYAANIYKLIGLIGEPLMTAGVELAIRILGIVAFPIGIIAGYF